jgi:hypothetical protein
VTDVGLQKAFMRFAEVTEAQREAEEKVDTRLTQTADPLPCESVNEENSSAENVVVH